MRQSAVLALSLLALACRPAPTAAPESPPQANETTPEAPPANPEPPPVTAPELETLPADPESGPPIHHGVTAAELNEVCDELAEGHDEPLLACDWLPGGEALADGARVDLLEITADYGNYGETSWAYLILRVGEERQISELGESYFVPGEEAYYELGKLKIDGDTILLPWTASSDIYPNTGNPDEPSGMYTESASFATRCSISNVSCQRELLD